MTIPVELEAKILRLYHAEKWPCGTIAKQLCVHRETVQRVLTRAGLPRIGPVSKPSMIEPYLPFIVSTRQCHLEPADDESDDCVGNPPVQ
ncbi:Homeodomain-like domain-containing protein [Burkholderia pyrrocinia]|uniref:Homeodomain-like domain-containing protein n=1 Tax=Burkholderia pyrrocinia TaxID=60550 RepID=A0A318I117_BURPY|nr:helix-turn-helix domain-containing protein [Burkholderia pyrrocinia]PXX21317.1 Homeodomain-like domain-containing protein [Burkholderia pyrrocinia]